jgi:methionyl-tRNA formyltransferase
VTPPNSLKIIFAGTPAFAATLLNALLQTSHQIVGVYTQPDRPAGRGRKLTASPVKQLALEHQLNIFQPMTLRDADAQKILADLNADLMIVVAYGLLLPNVVLTTPRLGCINVHASLLPKWRGAAPIQRAILAGDKKTGITLMQMDEGLDTGNMLLKMECPISESTTSEALHDALAELGAKILLTWLDAPDSFPSETQDNALATYAHKIKKEEAQIDWNLPAKNIVQTIRAFNPWPVAFSYLGQKIIRIWEAEVVTNSTISSIPGTIISASSQGIDIATQKDVVRLLKLQLPGGKILSVSDILNAHKSDFAVSNILGTYNE